MKTKNQITIFSTGVHLQSVECFIDGKNSGVGLLWVLKMKVLEQKKKGTEEKGDGSIKWFFST